MGMRNCNYERFDNESTEMLSTNDVSCKMNTNHLKCSNDTCLNVSEIKRMTKNKKSSCVNARGVPTAAYQVLHLLRGVGPPSWSTPSSHPDLARGGGGVLYPWLGVPPAWDTPRPNLGPVNGCTPLRKAHRTMEVLWHGDGVTPPPPLGCEHTENINASLVLRTRSVTIGTAWNRALFASLPLSGSLLRGLNRP